MGSPTYKYLVLSGFVFYSEFMITRLEVDQCYFTNLLCDLASRHKSNRSMQVILFLISIAAGVRLIYEVNYANWRVNMREVFITEVCVAISYVR